MKRIITKTVKSDTHKEFISKWKDDNKKGWFVRSSGYDGKQYWRRMEKIIKKSKSG